MSFGLDPVISNVFFTMSLIPNLGKVKKPLIAHTPAAGTLPLVSVLITFCKEKKEDIDMTVSSLIRQTYPKDKMEVLMMVEPDDIKVQLYVRESIAEFDRAGIFSRMILSDGKLKIKPHALNIGLKKAKGVYCAFYDAADEIEEDQIEKAVSLMVTGNYDAAQAKVLRKGRGLLSRFLYIDTIVWYTRSLPMILKFANGIPLSGEGLFVKLDTLEKAGYFKELLAEDAYLGLILTEQGRRFTLLDSTVIEKAPKNIISHFRQKCRWHRGYLSCLRRLLPSGLTWRAKFFLFLPFIAPISCCLGFLGWLSIGIHYLIIRNFFPVLNVAPLWMQHPLYIHYIRFWSIALVMIGFPLAIISQAGVLARANEKRHIPATLLFPAYWLFIGFCAMCSFFRRNHIWTKTER